MPRPPAGLKKMLWLMVVVAEVCGGVSLPQRAPVIDRCRKPQLLNQNSTDSTDLGMVASFVSRRLELLAQRSLMTASKTTPLRYLDQSPEGDKACLQQQQRVIGTRICAGGARRVSPTRLSSNRGSAGPPNPLVDGILPSLLFVRLGSLLDHALREYISQNGLMPDRTYRGDFNGRIAFMADSGLLLHATAWHAIREKRNLLAHTLWNKCDWPVLQQAIDTADDELRHLGMAGPKPVFEFFGEQYQSNLPSPKSF